MAAVRVLHEIQISPSPSLPSQPPQALTFLDTLWLQNSRPMEKLFFYDFPHPTSHFIDHKLPILTRSLSLTLRHFYFLAGSIRRSYDFEDQFEIAYEEGDSITITVAEFTGDDFLNISGYRPKNFKNLSLLVPKPLKLPSGQFPPMLIQITIFPNQGLCIGFATNHAVCDGFGTKLFFQSWAASCRSSKPTLNDISPPFFERSVIIDSHGIGKKLSMAMSQSKENLQEQGNLPVSHPILVHATFTLRKNHILQLKELVHTKQVEQGKPSYHLSAFVVACAYVWRCLVKTRGCEDGEINQYFGIVVDWRSRMRPSIPSNYFGNCLVAFLTELKATQLVGNDGFEVAAMEIGKNIDGLQGREVGELVEATLNKFPEIKGRQTITVSGSPKLRAYDVDFGWGRPVKVDIISIIETGAISFAESRDEEGGIEIALVLSEEEMHKFEMNFATSFLGL
ncbi:hypothetical protein KFK09_023691 [Dendrobium nobile]|uniref:Uncharacterized protein n=1 Tax=Dendrobium nobile TaxID=94219 RepID=A0A8T3ACQ4_DENNO|nr:hypothetical protein KFK09_023691 [Dendrobium nobile]